MRGMLHSTYAPTYLVGKCRQGRGLLGKVLRQGCRSPDSHLSIAQGEMSDLRIMKFDHGG